MLVDIMPGGGGGAHLKIVDSAGIPSCAGEGSSTNRMPELSREILGIEGGGGGCQPIDCQEFWTLSITTTNTGHGELVFFT